MTVEVFNQRYYVLQAATVDPDLLVSVEHSGMYQISGISPDRVFVQQHAHILISGGATANITIPKINMLYVTGPVATTNFVRTFSVKLFQITGGGNLTRDQVNIPITKIYEITS